MICSVSRTPFFSDDSKLLVQKYIRLLNDKKKKKNEKGEKSEKGGKKLKTEKKYRKNFGII